MWTASENDYGSASGNFLKDSDFNTIKVESDNELLKAFELHSPYWVWVLENEINYKAKIHIGFEKKSLVKYFAEKPSDTEIGLLIQKNKGTGFELQYFVDGIGWVSDE